MLKVKKKSGRIVEFNPEKVFQVVMNALDDIEKLADNEWQEERANKEYRIQIWKNFSQLTDAYYHWVKGHDVTQGNIMADQMANETMDEMESRYK